MKLKLLFYKFICQEKQEVDPRDVSQDGGLQIFVHVGQWQEVAINTGNTFWFFYFKTKPLCFLNWLHLYLPTVSKHVFPFSV